MDWDKLKIFHAVAEAGSFTNATVNLNLSQSAISRQIQALEHDLKVQLFERHARGLTLTENGEYVFKTAHEVISKLKEVETSLGDQKNKPTGKLTITTVRSFGTHWLTPRIQEFMRLNPEIEIELVFDDKELDLSTRQADIGIWMRRPKQLNHILKKLDDYVFVTSGDLPLLDESIVKQIVDAVNSDKTWTSIVTTKSFQSSLGLNPECIILFNNESYVHTGISIVNASEIKNLESVKEDYLIMNDKRVCLNVNTKTDFDLLSSL